MGAIREIKQKYFGEGDLEAFFGLFGDVFSKIAAIIGVLYFAEGFPADIVMGKILPGIGVGSIAGSLIYFWEAYDLGKKEGRTDVTALPFGVSSTQVFAWIYLIIVPIYRQTGNALHAWQVAVAACFLGGLVEIAGGFVSKLLMKWIPNAALMGNMAAGALVWLSLNGFVTVFETPLVSVIPLFLIFLAQKMKKPLIKGIPNTVLIVGTGVALAWLTGQCNIVALQKSAQTFGVYPPQLSILDVTKGISQIGPYVNDGLVCEKVNNVYGKLMFGEVPEDRPITYASYVMSVDGKIAFEDNEVGPMIAKTNHLDKDGATADFWVLNLLRANCDGIIIGSGTMIKEPDYSGSAYDPDLLQARIDNGKSVAPWTVIVTTTGKNIPFGNPVFSQEEIPMLVATSEEGIKNLKQEITKEYYELPLVKTEEDKKKIKELIAENEGKIAVLVTGEGKNTDAAEMLKVLRAMGMEKVLVESPTYCHHMMREGLLDEIFINTSCIFVGGQATGIGTSSKSFPSTDHPHSEIVTMHMHSPHFIYTRYKMLYGIK